MTVSSLYVFEISLHRHPREHLAEGLAHTDTWGTWPTVIVPHEMLAMPLTISFDDAIDRLSRLERMYAEPDGSFVWVSPREGLSWQVDGNVFDRDGRVVLVDMKGSCPPAAFDQLLSCFGWPAEQLLFQLVRSAVFLTEPVFRRHAGAQGLVRSGQDIRS